MITTVNPNEIVLIGMSLTKTEISDIMDGCCNVASAQNMPIIVSEENVKETLMKGLATVAVDRLVFPLSRPL